VQKIYCLTKAKLHEQYMLWRAVGSSFPVNDIQVLENNYSKSVDDRKRCPKKITNANKNLNLRMSAGSVIQRQEPEEWSSSDEETLDMMSPLVFVKLCEMSDSSDDELLSCTLLHNLLLADFIFCFNCRCRSCSHSPPFLYQGVTFHFLS
jgi:hypothetical protein